MRVVLVSFAVFSFCYMANGQSFYWAEGSASMKGFSEGSQVEVDEFNNSYVFGSYTDELKIGGFHFKDSLFTHYFLAKFDPQGETIWVKNIGLSGVVLSGGNQLGMTIGGEGNVYITGPSKQGVYFDELTLYDETSGDDFFVAKISPDGQVLTAFKQHAFKAVTTDIAVDDSGNIYVSGAFKGPLYLGAPLNTTITSSTGRFNCLIIKYDANGNPQWQRNFGNTSNDNTSFAVDVVGSNVFWGFNYATGTFGSRLYNSYIYKLTSENSIVWFHYVRSGASDQYNYGYGMHAVEGAVYLTGGYRTQLTFSSNAGQPLNAGNTNTEAYLLKVLDNGISNSFGWATKISGTGNNTGYGIATSGTDVYWTGSIGSLAYLSGIAMNAIETQGNLFIATLNAGNGLGTAATTPNYKTLYNNSFGYDLATATDGRPVVTGTFSNQLGFGDEWISSAAKDFFVLKMDTSLGSLQFLKSGFRYKITTDKSTVDLSGNLYAAGILTGTYGDENYTFVSRGSSDIIFSKYNSLGELQWMRTGGSSLQDHVEEIISDESAIYLTGTYSETMYFDEEPLPLYDEDKEVYVAKYDFEGNKVWAISAVSGEADRFVEDIGVDAEGNVYITGEFDNNPTRFSDFYFSDFSLSDRNSYVVKFNSSGEFQWFDYIQYARGTALYVAEDGSMYVAGQFFSPATDIAGHTAFEYQGGANDLFVVRYSSTGEVENVVTAGGGNLETVYEEEKINDIKISAGGDVFLTGFFEGELRWEAASSTGTYNDIFVAKLDAGLQLQWLSSGGGGDDDQADALVVDSQGDVFIAGRAQRAATFGDFNLSGAGYDDYMIVLAGLDGNNGNFFYVRDFGYSTDCGECAGTENGASLSIDANDQFYLSGKITGPVEFYPVQIENYENFYISFASSFSLDDCAIAGAAGFNGVSNVCLGEEVSFDNTTDLINHTVTGWFWETGDGSTYTSENITHTYATNGVYTVSLTAFYVEGCEVTATSQVGVQSPVISAGGDGETCEGEEIVLGGSFGGSVESVIWSTLGDGLFSDETDPQASYTPGTSDIANREVKLVLSSNDLQCGVRRDTTNISIRSLADAQVSAGADQEICAGEETVLDGSFGGDVSAVDWTTLGDGLFSDESNPQASYTPGTADIANREVKLVLSSNDLLCGVKRDTTTISIRSLADAQVSAGADQEICAGEETVLAGSFGGDVTAVAWTTLGDGLFSDETDPQASYTPGTSDITNREVKLVLSSNDLLCGVKRDTTTISIRSLADALVNAGEDMEICAGEGVVLDGGFGGDVTAVVWNTLGDGLFSDESDPQASYTPGTADLISSEVKLVLSSNDLLCGVKRDTTTISIRSLTDALVSAGADKEICAGEETVLDGSFGGDVTAVAWTTLGDGLFSDESNPQASYTPGTSDIANREAKLVLSSNDLLCGLKRDTTTISIRSLTDALVNAGADQEICAGEETVLDGSFGGDVTAVAWSTLGDGLFSDESNPQASYTPGTADLISREVKLVLSSNDLQCGVKRDTTTINIRSLADALVNAGADMEICAGEEAVLDGSFGGDVTAVTWTTLGHGLFSDETEPQASYTPGTSDIANREVKLVLSSNDLLCGLQRDTLLLNIYPALNPGDQQILLQAGDSVSLTILNSSQVEMGYQLSVSGTPEGATVEVNQGTVLYQSLNSATGSHTFTYQVTAPCGSVTRATVSVELIAAECATDGNVFAGEDFTACPAVVDLQGAFSGGVTSLGWVSAGDGTFTSDTHLLAHYQPGSGDLKRGYADLILRGNAGCAAVSDSIRVSFTGAPVANNLQSAAEIDKPVRVNLAELNAVAAGSCSFEIVESEGRFSSVIEGAELIFTAVEGSVGVIVLQYFLTNECGLTAAGSIEFVVANVPPEAIPMQYPTSLGGELEIALDQCVNDQNGNIDWSTLTFDTETAGAKATVSLSGEASLLIDYHGTVFTGTDELNFSVCDEMGACVSSKTEIEVEPLEVIVYNAVSPNGDGKHDFLKIQHAERFQNMLRIFNRHGDLVYEKESYDNASGVFSGYANTGLLANELPAGTYYYQFELPDLKKSLKGSILLKR